MNMVGLEGPKSVHIKAGCRRPVYQAMVPIWAIQNCNTPQPSLAWPSAHLGICVAARRSSSSDMHQIQRPRDISAPWHGVVMRSLHIEEAWQDQQAGFYYNIYFIHLYIIVYIYTRNISRQRHEFMHVSGYPIKHTHSLGHSSCRGLITDIA